MEAVPRLPMIQFELKVSTEPAQFGPQLKAYIASFYSEEPESYNAEISNLEALRGAAVRPTIDVSGCQLLKKYYCQLHFLKSRFPMAELQAAAVFFSWKDSYSNMPCGVPDIRFELMCVLYNIGALHSQLGALESRTTQDGMKMACTHFQCAAWAFQTVKENYYQMVPYMSSVEVVHFMQQVCMAQAQECILEKSMMDNRKATIIAKVAVQVVDFYRRSLNILQSSGEETSFNDLVGSKTYKDWVKYLSFKIAYHKCIALLYQGQQAEEQQKMGERVAFYQAACEQLEEATKLGSSLKQQKEIAEALAFTTDVVEGKRKAAKNENEFIYHEEVPEKHALQEMKEGASLVKGIAFSVNDPEVSGPDIFARLVPMEAHEASSLYSEKKAQMIRQLGELVEAKDQALAEFMSSMQLDVFNQMRQATGLPQDLVDRAAALSVKTGAAQELVSAMGKLSNSFHDVEAMLNDIQEYLKEEEQNEKEYQEIMGKRPPSIIATDLSREAAKYREAHSKANDSNQNLHKAMMTHVANLRILAQPLRELQQQIPAVEFPNPNIDEKCIKELEMLISKVEEMRNQRAMLWTQFRDAVHEDDITSALVTRQADQPLDQLFQQELQKHQHLASLIEQNAAAQENIFKAFVDVYARSSSTRRYLQDIINKRSTTIAALVTSFDTYEDFLAKANKGIEFYAKLETNVSKLLQRIKSASKVQQEEREQMLAKTNPAVPSREETPPVATPKLKDYLDTRRKPSPRPAATYPVENPTAQAQYPPQATYPASNIASEWPPAVRPNPVGSEVNNDISAVKLGTEYSSIYPYEYYPTSSIHPTKPVSGYTVPGGVDTTNQNLNDRMRNLRVSSTNPAEVSQYHQFPNQEFKTIPGADSNDGRNVRAYTATTDTYQPISSSTQNTTGYPPIGSTEYYYNNAASIGYTVPPATVSVPAPTSTSTTPMYGQNYYQNYGAATTDLQKSYGQDCNYPAASANLVAPAAPPVSVSSYGAAHAPPTTQQVPAQYPDNYDSYAAYYAQAASMNSGYPMSPQAYGTAVGHAYASASETYSTTPANTGAATVPSTQDYTYPSSASTEGQYYQPKQNNGYGVMPSGQGVVGTSSQVYVSQANYVAPGTVPPTQGRVESSGQVYGSHAYAAPPAGATPNQDYGSSALPDNQVYQAHQNQSYSYAAPAPNSAAATNMAVSSTQGYSSSYSTPENQAYQANSRSHLNQSLFTSVPNQVYSEAANATISANQNYAGSTGEAPSAQIGAIPVAQQYSVQPGQVYQTSQQNYTLPPNSSVYNAYGYGYTSDGSSVPSPIPAQPTPVSQTSSQISVPPPTIKESNLDLLTGLDFSVNQAPLIPSQPSSVKKETPSSTHLEKQLENNTSSQPALSTSVKGPVESTSREEVQKVVDTERFKNRKPLNNAEVKKLVLQEVDKFAKVAEVLSNKTLSGPTNLDLKWKEIQDKQECDGQRKAISVARCYPMKNRFPDILPYDYSRVKLQGAKDDYINASFVKDISYYSPPFIVTQAPLHSTFVDFWTMIKEQKVEVIACLTTESELGTDIYWPSEKGKELYFADMVVSLISATSKPHWTERLISLNMPEKKDSRVVMHLHFTSWPGSLFPTSPDAFVSYVVEVLSLYHQQRAMMHPVVVHCSSGIGRSGLACLMMAAICEMTNNSSSVPDLISLTSKLSGVRKNILRDREHLKFAHEALLAYMKQLISQTESKKSLQSIGKSQSEEVKTPKPASEPDDPLSSLDPFWASKK